MSDIDTGTDLDLEDQPSSEDPTLDDENQGDDEGTESSFLDDYDLGDVPEEARPVAEAAIKRLNAAYTRQRQQDAQVVRDAQQSQQIVDGLLDPQTRTGVAEALGLELTQEEEAELDDEFGVDPNERIDALEQRLAQKEQLSAAEARTQAENGYVTEQIAGLEQKLGSEFSDEEIELLYLLADEHRDQKGAPDVESAYRILDAVGAGKRAKPKPKPKVRRMGGGSAGERQADLSDEEERKEVMLAAWRAAKASSE
jgi:hypothetical protein